MNKRLYCVLFFYVKKERIVIYTDCEKGEIILTLSKKDRELLLELICNEQFCMIAKDIYDDITSNHRYQRLEKLKIKLKKENCNNKEVTTK